MITEHPFYPDSESMVRVNCKDCGCAGKSYSTGHTMGFGNEPTRYVTLEEAKVKAITTWNKRPTASGNMDSLETERENYISSLPFAKAAEMMERAKEAADLFKYADIEDSLFCERMMKIYGCVPLESDKSNLITFLITLFNYGKVQGIRVERARRKRGARAQK